MPQATAELRAEWRNDDHATKFLQRRGYVLVLPQYEWRAPARRVPTAKEARAIVYMAQEWDFGGLCT